VSSFCSYFQTSELGRPRTTTIHCLAIFVSIDHVRRVTYHWDSHLRIDRELTHLQTTRTYCHCWQVRTTMSTGRDNRMFRYCIRQTAKFLPFISRCNAKKHHERYSFDGMSTVQDCRLQRHVRRLVRLRRRERPMFLLILDKSTWTTSKYIHRSHSISHLNKYELSIGYC
jgi:hypothetical protein